MVAALTKEREILQFQRHTKETKTLPETTFRGTVIFRVDNFLLKTRIPPSFLRSRLKGSRCNSTQH